jgi:hypothetical protein
MRHPPCFHFCQSQVSDFLSGVLSSYPGEIADNRKTLKKHWLGWNEMRVRPFFDIKAGGVGLSRKPGDQTNSLLGLPDPKSNKNHYCYERNAMKTLFIVALVALSLTSHVNAEESGQHLFILSGQSNMVGLKANMSFLPAVTKEFGKDHVIVVKDAWDGQPIRQWYKKWKPAQGDQPKVIGALYDLLMTKVNAAIKDKRIKTMTFVWMQGESDAKEKHGEVYAASLKGLLDQLKKDLGRSDINVVIGRISDFDMGDKKFPHWTMVRKAQVEVAESSNRYAWVDTDDLNGAKNGLHYDPEGYETLGKRFAEKAIELINNNPNKPNAGDGK